MEWTDAERAEIVARISALEFMVIANTVQIARFVGAMTKTKSRLPETMLEDAHKQKPVELQLDSKRFMDSLKQRNEILAGLLAKVRQQLG